MYINPHERDRGYPHVTFLHKNVYEFLSSPEVRQELAAAASPPGGNEPWCAAAALMHSALMRIKTWGNETDWAPRFKPYQGCLRFAVDLDTLVYRFLSLVRETEAATGKPQIEMLDELDRVMGRYYADHGGDGSLSHWAGALHLHDRHRVNHLHKVAPMESLLSLAVSQGLSLYVRHVVANDPAILRGNPRRPLLYDALFPFGGRFGKDKQAGDDDLDPNMIVGLFHSSLARVINSKLSHVARNSCSTTARI